MRVKKKKLDLSSLDAGPLTLADALGLARESGVRADGEARRDTRRPSQAEILKTPVRIALERKGRAGKLVTRAAGLTADAGDGLVGDLKRELGCGASAGDGAVYFQGDQRERLLAALRKRKFADVKIS